MSRNRKKQDLTSSEALMSIRGIIARPFAFGSGVELLRGIESVIKSWEGRQK